MNLTELLIKRNKKEDLTEDELLVLKQYDDSIAEYTSKIEKLETEKSVFETKFNSADTELQKKVQELADSEKILENVKYEKNTLDKALENTKTTAEARAEAERMKVEKVKAEAIRKAEEDKVKALEAEKAKIDELNKKVEESNAMLATMQFRNTLHIEKSKRPYLAKQLDKIISEIGTKELSKLVMSLEILLGMFDHDEEMEKWKANQDKSTSIFTKTETKLVDDKNMSKPIQKTDSERYKELGFKVRKK